MYSVLPAAVAFVFLGCGCYLLYVKGFTRIAVSFFVLCLTTFSWLFAWAVLFQVSEPGRALFVIKGGYLLILFLPTALYHFLVELTERRRELAAVYTSYALAAVLGAALLGSDRIVAGYYQYFWGYYPRAGSLHWLHLLHGIAVVARGLYITYQSAKTMPHFRAVQLRYCFVALLVYCLAVVDYLCNYGYEFYPPGVVFVSISLGIITVAIVRYRLMDDPATLKANLAHQVRTPLLTIQMQASAIDDYWPALIEGYERAVNNGLSSPAIRRDKIERLRNIARVIDQQVHYANTLVDMLLASTNRQFEQSHPYAICSARRCVEEAVRRFPFTPTERRRLTLDLENDFDFYGSDALFIYVLFNLMRNALHAVETSGKGKIVISLKPGTHRNKLYFTDTASGIDDDVLPHIFDNCFTTKTDASGAGIGLAFCRRVMADFRGDIRCFSRPGEYTRFVLGFPRVESTVLEIEKGTGLSGKGVLEN